MARVPVGEADITEEELSEVLKVGQNYLTELDETLKDIYVPARIATNPEVVEAVKYIFGDEFINEKGEAYISYKMFRDCMVILRNVGRATAAEFVK